MKSIPAIYAVKTALDRIRACAATAAFAALIVPLAVPAAQAAILAAPPSPYVLASSFNINGTNFISYTVFNTNGLGAITQIELPEIHAGDINFNFLFDGSGGILGSGFNAYEYPTAQFSTSTIVDGTVPGAYVDLYGTFTGAFTQNGILPNGSQSFIALVPTTATTEANFTLSDRYTSDPPIPDTGITAVPEPASLALIGAGLLAMTGLRRRKA